MIYPPQFSILAWDVPKTTDIGMTTEVKLSFNIGIAPINEGVLHKRTVLCRPFHGYYLNIMVGLPTPGSHTDFVQVHMSHRYTVIRVQSENSRPVCTLLICLCLV